LTAGAAAGCGPRKASLGGLSVVQCWLAQLAQAAPHPLVFGRVASIKPPHTTHSNLCATPKTTNGTLPSTSASTALRMVSPARVNRKARCKTNDQRSKLVQVLAELRLRTRPTSTIYRSDGVLYLSLIWAPATWNTPFNTSREYVVAGERNEHSARPIRTNPRWLVRAFVHLLRTIRDHGTPLQFLSAVLGSERCPTEPKPKALTIAVRANVNRAVPKKERRFVYVDCRASAGVTRGFIGEQQLARGSVRQDRDQHTPRHPRCTTRYRHRRADRGPVWDALAVKVPA
jgi:hypothetical protein